MKDGDALDVQRLVALKRFERPEDGFLDHVERDFHKRLRTEVLRQEQRSWKALWDRVVESIFNDPLLAMNRLATAGACAALVIIATAYTPAGAGQGTASAASPEHSSYARQLALGGQWTLSERGERVFAPKFPEVPAQGRLLRDFETLVASPAAPQPSPLPTEDDGLRTYQEANIIF